MTLLRKLHGYIQPHVVTVFSVLLLVSFAMVGLVFNLGMNRYIHVGAINALREARAIFTYDEEAQGAGPFMRAVRGSHRFSYENVYSFHVEHDFTLRYLEYATSAEVLISDYFVQNPPRPPYSSPYWASSVGQRIRKDGRTFFASATPVSTVGFEHWDGFVRVHYIEVTDLMTFISVVNRLLLVSVSLIWLVSMVIAGLLVDSMMRPLLSLRDFVRRIGRGDFSPNSQTFSNDMFEELNQTLNHSAGQLAHYDAEQKAFFQNVSHEFRTPLMAIHSYALGINQGIMESKDASATILEATNRLTGMVEDILYVSRIDSVTTPPMVQANLCAIVEEQIRRQKAMAEAQGIEIKFVFDGEPIWVNCVQEYIERAVANLISNATRYARTTILVECYAIGGSATIRVSDDGPGFEPEAIAHVFERFYRGKNGLTGIGLATVKSITDQHKGWATAENGEESGAILTISIPRLKGSL